MVNVVGRKNVILSHKIELKPNEQQTIYFKKACGCARLAYNWAIAKRDSDYQTGVKSSGMQIKKEFNAIKREQFPFITEVTKCAPENALLNACVAFDRFFKKQGQHPQFHKKGRHDSFVVDNTKFKVDDRRVNLPKLGWVKLTETLRFQGRILSATISRQAHKWFISIAVDLNTENNRSTCENQAVVGVDLGIKSFATLSTGEVFASPKPLKANLKKLKRKQRQLCRKVKGSSNREKAKDKVARLHYRIACIRKDFLNKLTTYLCKNFLVISIEDLATSNMLKNHNLARAISDMGWYEFKRQLQYKAAIYGSVIRVINRFEATSKTCSHCGWKKTDLTLGDRIFRCESCGLEIDRDLNASMNISTAGLAGTQACGDLPESKKQEIHMGIIRSRKDSV